MNSIIKYSILVALAFSCILPISNAFAQDNWTFQGLPFRAGHLYDIFFTGEDTGWAVGFDGFNEKAAIIHTVNGGALWELQETDLTAVLYGIHMTDRNVGYAVGEERIEGAWKIVILKTTDGGQQWERQVVPDLSGQLQDVFFTSSGQGLAVGVDNTNLRTLILRTTNGVDWQQINHSFHMGVLNAVHFSDGLHGWAVGRRIALQWNDPPFVFNTIDGGVTWTGMITPVSNGAFLDVFFTTQDSGIVVGSSGDNGVVLRTIDGGESWDETLFLPDQLPKPVSENTLNSESSTATFAIISAFLHNSVGILTGQGYQNSFYFSQIFKTDNSGVHWTSYGARRSLLELMKAFISPVGELFATGTTPGDYPEYPHTPVIGKGNAPWKDELRKIVLDPNKVTLAVNDKQEFTAKGEDPYGNKVDMSNPVFDLSGGGTLEQSNSSAEFTAQEPGDWILSCTDQNTGISGEAFINVYDSGYVASIFMIPENINLKIGEEKKFVAMGKNDQGNPATIQEPVWSTTGGGTLVPNGAECIYKALLEGNWMITCTDQRTGKSAEASINVTTPDSVYAWVDENGVLHIKLWGNANVKIGVDENGNVLVNGQPVGDPPVKAEDLKGINVEGGDGDNVIDLSDVILWDFPNIEDGKIYMDGGAGNDQMYGSEFGDIMHGGDGEDYMDGGPGEDYMDGGPGDDSMEGGGGNDTIFGGLGNDTMYGGNGDDYMDGGPGDDAMFGGGGDDKMFGGDGNDYMEGGDGDDYMFGGDGNDEMRGGGGNNTMYGGNGDDKMYGGAGNSKMYGGPGNNELYAGPRDDRIVVEPGSTNVLSDEGGNDTVDFSPANFGITIDLDLQYVDQVVDTAGNIIRLEGEFENFTGSDFDDVVYLYPLDVPRRIDGGGHMQGDTIYIDAKGLSVTQTDSTLTVEGYAPITYYNASVNIIHRVLERIEVAPSEVTLQLGEEVQFIAAGFDGSNNTMPVTLIWSTTGGSIDSSGLYTATEAGEFTVMASVDGSSITGISTVRVIRTSVDRIGDMPKEFTLSQNYPNPFNPETIIEYSVKEACHVRLEIYNVVGRNVFTLVNGFQQPGVYRVKFESGNLSTGVYFYRIRMNDFVAVKKMVLLQ